MVNELVVEGVNDVIKLVKDEIKNQTKLFMTTKDDKLKYIINNNLSALQQIESMLLDNYVIITSNPNKYLQFMIDIKKIILEYTYIRLNILVNFK